MIQRKQTLFLLLIIFTSIALLIMPSNFVHEESILGVSFLSLYTGNFHSGMWHYIGFILIVIASLLALITIFIYKKRSLQIRLCYALMLLELFITLIITLCPLVIKAEGIIVESSGMATIIGVIGMMSAYLAARYIKKDIELLKSADRIR
jgi:hypothetical protein